jgi:tryptophan synthase alpha subunit
MNRIAKRFASLAETGRKALIPYVTAGDPVPEVTLPLLAPTLSNWACRFPIRWPMVR